MRIPQFSNRESIPDIVVWFLTYDEKINADFWDDNELRQKMIDWQLSVFNFSKSEIKDSLNVLFHEFTFIISPKVEELIENSTGKEEELYFLKFRSLFITAQLRIAGWIYHKKFNEEFEPFGNTLEILNIFEGFVNYYSVLGISSTAGVDEIKAAYRNKAKEHHPDVVGGNTAAFKLVKEAQEILSDQSTRAEFDDKYELYKNRHLYDMKANKSTSRSNNTNKKENSYSDDINKPTNTQDVKNNTYSSNQGLSDDGKLNDFNFKVNWGTLVGIAVIVLFLFSVFGNNATDDNNYYVNSTSTTKAGTTEDYNSPEDDLESTIEKLTQELNDTYIDFNLFDINVNPFFLVTEDIFDEEKHVVVYSAISNEAYRYLLQSSNREKEIAELVNNFSSRPKEEITNVPLVVFLLYVEEFLEKPSDPIYKNAVFEESEKGWYLTQYLAVWDSGSGITEMNTELPIIEKVINENNEKVTIVAEIVEVKESDNVNKTPISNEENNVMSEKQKSDSPSSVNKDVEEEIHKNPTSFTIGSTKTEVEEIMGTPTAINKYSNYETWSYGLSSIELDQNGQVTDFSNYNNTLKVSIGEKKESAPPFTIGSSKQQVIDALGTPTAINKYSNYET